MSKNLIIFSDGTGHEGGEGFNTNIYKLFNVIEERTPRQIAFYDPGVGTDGKLVTGNAFGRGFTENMMQCYRFLFENYQAGDSIFLFGFSRGAATVRSLSGFVHLFGILPKCRPELIDDAFEIYKIENKKKRETKAAAFILKNHTMWCRIHFVGVFDTVAALGFPYKRFDIFIDRFFKHRFHDFYLSNSVRYARQAMAIDDERKTFLPIIWNKVKNNDGDKMKQVWFCGAHTDVGGGYEDSGLSDISLVWMIYEATEKGLLLYENAPELKEINQNCNGEMHDERKSCFGRFYRRAVRTWDTQGNDHGGNKIERDTICIHQSVFERTLNRDNNNALYSPWIFKYRDKCVKEPWIKDINRTFKFINT